MSRNSHNLSYPLQSPLNVGAIFNARIQHYVSPHEFYVNLYESDSEVPYEELARGLGFIEPPALTNPCHGDACIILEMGINTRGVVLSNPTFDVCRALEVDRGHEGWYKLENIKLIPKEFLKLPPLAIRCCLKGFEDITDGSEVDTFEYYYRKFREFRLHIVSRETNCYVVELETSTTGEKLHELIVPCYLNASDWSENRSTTEITSIEHPFCLEKSSGEVATPGHIQYTDLVSTSKDLN